MKKKSNMFKIIAGFLFLIFCGYQITPVKAAIRPDELEKLNTPYYLVKWTRTTQSTWMIIADENGAYAQAEYVSLQGEIPDIVQNYDIATGDNVYLCYGEYRGEIETAAREEPMREYYLSGWDILYPVKRNAIFSFWPKSYLCQMDINAMR